MDDSKSISVSPNENMEHQPQITTPENDNVQPGNSKIVPPLQKEVQNDLKFISIKKEFINESIKLCQIFKLFIEKKLLNHFKNIYDINHFYNKKILLNDIKNYLNQIITDEKIINELKLFLRNNKNENINIEMKNNFLINNKINNNLNYFYRLIEHEISENMKNKISKILSNNKICNILNDRQFMNGLNASNEKNILNNKIINIIQNKYQLNNQQIKYVIELIKQSQKNETEVEEEADDSLMFDDISSPKS